MPQNENRNHYYNTTKRNNNPAREFVRGNNNQISRRIYNPGYDTSRDYSHSYNEFHDDGDVYENEFVNDNENINYNTRPERKNPNQRRGKRGFFERVGHNIKEAWNEWRHHDSGADSAYHIENIGYPREYGDDNRSFYDRRGELYDRERRRQRTQYFADNDFDSIYNAEDENSYTGYDRRHSPYDYQDEYDDNFADYNENYNAVNSRNYDDYRRGRREFDYDTRKNEIRRRRARFSM